MFVTRLYCALFLASCVCAERWAWPDSDGADSVRIDNKVRFVDAPETQRNSKRDSSNVQADEIPFQEPTDTEGFYNRPPGAGRYPVRIEPDRSVRINGQDVYFPDGQRNQKYSDGTLDSIQHCKCVSRPDCKVQPDYENACGTNQYLCCFNIPNKQNYQSEYFNEVDNERPMLYPNEGIAGPFPSPHDVQNHGVFGPGHGHDNVLLGSVDRRRPQQNVLVGPGGPTGNIGPSKKPVLVGPGGPTGVVGPERPVLVGPQGPTGIIGPTNENHNYQNVLVGPNGSNGDIRHSETAQRGVLVGPGGPTGIIGPAYNRPVLVGPGGPTGIIGPGSRRQAVLVGPGGPTGIIGPSGFNRPSQRPGILVGPGGPTGIIGPGRQILVGPGGPTGQIGPRNYFRD